METLIAFSGFMRMLDAQVEEKKHHLDLTTVDPKAASSASAAPAEGSMVNAQITSLSGAAPRIAAAAAVGLAADLAPGSPQP